MELHGLKLGLLGRLGTYHKLAARFMPRLHMQHTVEYTTGMARLGHNLDRLKGRISLSISAEQFTPLLSTEFIHGEDLRGAVLVL